MDFNILPVISTNSLLIEQLGNAIQEGGYTNVDLPLISSRDEGIEYLNINLPDLFFLDISDENVDPYRFLEEVMKDPWLLHGGIIALSSSFGELKKLEDYNGANLLIAITYDEIPKQISKILGIVKANSNIIVQRAIGADLISNISGSFRMNNDTVEVGCYTNLICNFMYNTNRLSTGEKTKLNITINELLLNAVEHGNCGITYEDKTKWLESGKNIGELIDLRNQDSDISNRKVIFEFNIEKDESSFFIADEGNGFDWSEVKDVTNVENLFELHGRGIMMARNFTSKLEYNEKGNEVTFTITHEDENSALTPSIFHDVEAKTFSAGDVVFKQGEESNFLYYIVKGEYDVIVNDQVVSTLTPNDIFLGEMSFLLNNRRSATIVAAGEGTLMKISKKEFVQAIKNSPHYALFLSRLLAQRIDRLNLKTVANI